MERRDRLIDLLVSYYDERERGEEPSVERVCADCPDMIEAVRERVALHDQLDRLARPEEVNTIDWYDVTQDGEEPLPTVPGYEILGLLGKGGMGVVYKARQVNLDRFVALKMIRAGVGASADERARFRTEAEAIARLQHPGIVQIFELGEHAGLPFFSMEFVPGGSLAKRLGGPMQPLESARLVRLLARAVAHAHAHGVVHRDLKPENVLLAALADEPGLGCELGCPKVSDFGIARCAGGPALTDTGVVLGTLAYLAPEQIQGGEIGPPADVHALGAILYRLLTGHTPFESPSVSEILYKVAHREPPPPRQLCPEVPEELEALCLRCLHKDPAARFTAAQLAESLGTFLAGEPLADRDGADRAGQDREVTEEARITPAPHAPPVPSPPPPRRRLLLGLPVGACLGLALLAWWLGPLLRGKRPDGPDGPGEPLRIRPLKVMLFEPVGKQGVPRGQMGKDVFGAKFGDAVTITVELSEPAYLFVVGFNFDGKEQLVWPADDEGKPQPDRPPPKLPRLRFPAHDEDRLFLVEEGVDSGLQAYVAVASHSPLPGYARWRESRAGVKWARLPAVEKVWEADSRATYPVGLDGRADRGKVQPLPGEPPLAALCRALSADGESSEAVAFGVLAKRGQ